MILVGSLSGNHAPIFRLDQFLDCSNLFKRILTWYVFEFSVTQFFRFISSDMSSHTLPPATRLSSPLRVQVVSYDFWLSTTTGKSFWNIDRIRGEAMDGALGFWCGHGMA